MPVFISMSLVVLIWSLYPLIATFGLETMGSLELLLIVLVISSFGSFILATLYLWRRKKLKHALQIQNKLPLSAYIMALLSGVSGIFCHVFLFWALSLAHKGGVALLYDSWPIFALIAAPFLMKKQWKEVSLKEFIVSIVALSGVALVIFSDQTLDINFNNFSLNANFDYKALGGYVLAFAGGYMVALVAVSQGALAEHFKELDDDFGTTLISQVWGRTISVILAMVLYFFMAEPNNDFTANWGAILFIGIGVLVFGGALYTYSLLKANTPTVSIMYYFVPVLAVFWLWLAGESEINSGLFIGGAIILACNVYLFIAGRKAPLEQDL